MNSESDVAPAVQSILEAARERGRGEGDDGTRSSGGQPSASDGRISVEARSLPDAIERAERDGRVPVIAEVKPTSPTSDGTRAEDPVELAEAMVEGGASAISVLTEPTHFEGSPESLRRVREAVDVPVLRKDFVLREEQMDVVEADLVLLIARFVDDLSALVKAARDRGFQPLVEVHDAAELEAALEADASIVGVNNRDLTKLEVDLGTFEEVAPAVPEDVTLIAESGVSDPADVRRMREAGADALLIGSAIMDHANAGEVDIAENTRRLTRT
ncbi:indole-3-glycerol phosphate synthase [Halostagnicola kamekurae]|uniref:Indole-3-glycerol phosphate synthase n=1 Tax=Halostagnicola kamekurae TaxID=619731 RepID=A0A1I6RWJ7_9EURY|nr:indole-3-glycerol phosphate synthase [Halostagnicola kamekurae]SFS69091.1 indole-3-glycerol phosphate synthase [Halostagnicola kamekurae]